MSTSPALRAEQQTSPLKSKAVQEPRPRTERSKSAAARTNAEAELLTPIVEEQERVEKLAASVE
jgi:hypothetical protein